MQVYFLRHGRAQARADWPGDDADRPLTPEGIEALRREARTLRDRGVAVDLVVTSPLVRARQTAEIVAKRLGLAESLTEDDRLAHGFDAGRLAKLIAVHPGVEKLMLVGHEPDFSDTVSELIGGGAVVLKKGGLARVDLAVPTPGTGRLVWLLAPSHLGSE